MSYFGMAWLVLGLACVMQGGFALKRRRLTRWVSYPTVLLGFLLLTAGMYARGRTLGGCPIGTPFEVWVFLVWSLLFLFLILGPWFRLPYLAMFTSGLAALIGLTSLILPGMDSGTGEIVRRGAWVELHAGLALFSFGAFGFVAVISLMYLVQHYSLHWKKKAVFFFTMPSLGRLNKVSLWVHFSGVFLLSVAVFLGSFDWFYHDGLVPMTKWVIAVVLWLLYAGFLVFRMCGRVEGSLSAKLGVWMFVAALFMMLPLSLSHRSEAFPAENERTSVRPSN